MLYNTKPTSEERYVNVSQMHEEQASTAMSVIRQSQNTHQTVSGKIMSSNENLAMNCSSKIDESIRH